MSDDKQMSRRNFLRGVGALGAVAAVSSTVKLSAEEAPDAATGATVATVTPPDPSVLPVTAELPIPLPGAKPTETDFTCDVLVVGGGFAGLNAAVAAKEAGRSVILVDKGRPGYSGLAPFASSHRWFDAEMGDDAKAFQDCMRRGGEYVTNMDWYNVWIEESKATAKRLMDWGILTQFPKASDAGDYFDKADFPGYREKFVANDRRTKWMQVLVQNKIPVVERTMITNLVKQKDRIVGAMGFDVPTGAVLTFHAKSVVLCTGGGSYKPSGFPTSGDSFDGEFMGYQLGLPIGGKEFDDFHSTVSRAPGNAFLNNSWTYLENIWLCGGDVTAKTATIYADSKARVMVLDRVIKAVGGLENTDGSEIEDLSKSEATRRGGSVSTNPEEQRTGKKNDNMPKGDAYGAAVGMGAHLSSGIACPDGDLVGSTGIPGLYVAGDGTNSSFVSGAAYPCGVGFTSSFCSIQGWRSGKAAALYSAKAPTAKVSTSDQTALSQEIEAPYHVEKGFDANWARDELQAIMAPYWIHIAKNEGVLKGALAQVEYMRDFVIPKLKAEGPHDLRLCHEMKHKVLSAEMKLRAGIERKESRGMHYRTDYPFRDDANFLCHVHVQKAADGSMTLVRRPLKSDWTGDTTQTYNQRYGWYFPGEVEAKGLPAPKKERA